MFFDLSKAKDAALPETLCWLVWSDIEDDPQ